MSRPYLFSQGDWLSLNQGLPEKMRQEIVALPPQRILSSSLDDLCDYFVDSYSMEVPVLQKDGIVVDQQEKDIDVSRDWGRDWSTPGPHYMKGTEISVCIPFSGNPDLFRVRPNTFSSNPPSGEVNGQTLILKFSGTQLDVNAVRGQIDAEVVQIEGCLSTLRSNVEPYNKGIRQTARQQLEARRTKLLADQNLVSGLGFPLRERAEASRTYAPPQVRRKLKPSLPPQSTEPFKPEPALTSDDYEHILGVMQNMAQVMEKSPSAFKAMDEEALRTHFLVQLNGWYEGQATGETFNYGGKTDILLSVDGRNIFIGECKYWSGPKMLRETLDQLLSYSSWRDTKSAVIIFNRNKNFTSVLQAIMPAIQEHPNFKRSLPIQGETLFRFVLSNKDDPAREMIVTILAFEVPSGKEPEKTI
jgi:hypothetical protein